MMETAIAAILRESTGYRSFAYLAPRVAFVDDALAAP
jgi:hypothetical protein